MLVRNKNISNKIIILFFILLLLIFFADRLTKFIAFSFLENCNLIFINKYFNLTSVWNTGVGFGLLSFMSSFVLVFFSCFIAVCLIFFFIKKHNTCIMFALSTALLVGGALGNVYDRLYYGAVYDFIDLHINNYHWPTFNFADIAVTFGSILIVFSSFFKEVV